MGTDKNGWRTFSFSRKFSRKFAKNVCLRICWLTLCRRGRWLHRYNVGVVVLEKNFKYKYLTARKIQTCNSLQTKLSYEDKSINRRQYNQADFSWAWSGTDSVRELEKIFKYKNLTARKQRVAIRYKKNLATKTNRLRIHRRQYHQADFSWTIGRGQKGRKRERSLIPYNTVGTDMCSQLALRSPRRRLRPLQRTIGQVGFQKTNWKT